MFESRTTKNRIEALEKDVMAILNNLKRNEEKIDKRVNIKPDTLYCDFCGRNQHEVKKLIAGPKVFICDGCVILCLEILFDVKRDSKDDTKKDG